MSDYLEVQGEHRKTTPNRMRDGFGSHFIIDLAAAYGVKAFSK
jgi:hypothetical protein